MTICDDDYLPLPGSACFCCERVLGSAVHVLGPGLFLCPGCDDELQERRCVYLSAEREAQP